MKILVTGGTGRVGKAVAASLQTKGVEVRVLTRQEGREASNGIEYVKGDLQDPDTVRGALEGVDKLFLLVANVADELTQTLLALDVAREEGIKHVTYLSVFKAQDFPEVPHSFGKNTVETSLRALGIPFTILRPGYFYQNDASLKAPLTGPGLYPTPIGTTGIAAVDIRDIADVAALTLTEDGHVGKTYNLVGPSPLDGPQAAAVWSKALSKPVNYPGLPPAAFEKQVRQFLPPWYAMELRVMFQAYAEQRFEPAQADVEVLTSLLGRDLRSYEAFVQETAANWASN